MALRWENPASTTHSLTPSPSNRPLIFWILTPRKKPEATGSAGRCEPGVGRFTDPHPLTCSFFTPPFCSAMFGLYEQPLQARPSLIFPFPPFFCPPVLSPAWMGWLSPIPFRRCPGFAHNWPTRLQQGWSGLCWCRFSTLSSNWPKIAAQERVWIFSPERAYPSP